MVQKKLTTIAISEENYEKLKKLGQAGDSFNDVLIRLLAEYKVKKHAHLEKILDVLPKE